MNTYSDDEIDWLTVPEVARRTGLGKSTIYKMTVPLVRNPEPIKGKFRRKDFRFPGMTRPLVRIVAEDVRFNFPPPSEFILTKARSKA
jgi:hypothetical protein